MSEVTPYSGLRKAKANDIEIAYDAFGDPQEQPIILNPR
jgi:hypothetical protein